MGNLLTNGTHLLKRNGHLFADSNGKDCCCGGSEPPDPPYPVPCNDCEDSLVSVYHVYLGPNMPITVTVYYDGPCTWDEYVSPTGLVWDNYDNVWRISGGTQGLGGSDPCDPTNGGNPYTGGQVVS